MNKSIIAILSLLLIVGIAYAANNPGSFGEYASLDACHCFIYNSISTTHTWVLVSTYDTPLKFYITKPNITNVAITTSVLNGTIAANSTYPINVTVISHTPVNESGYILAVAIPSNSTNTNTSSGETIQIGTEKLLEIQGNSSATTTTTSINPNKPVPLNGNNGSTTAVTSGVVSATNTTIHTTIRTQATAGTSGSSSIVTYLVIAVVVLIIIVCGLSYYMMSRNTNKGNKNRARSANSRRKNRKRKA